MNILLINTNKYTTIDEDDWEMLSKHAVIWCDQGVGHSGVSCMSKLLSKRVTMARLILKIEQTTLLADHIDGNYLNNTRKNLRVATYAQNMHNRKKNSSSVYKGVMWDRARAMYRCRLKHQGKEIHLGRFLSAKEAAKAYDVKALELWGSFAKLNFPLEVTNG